MNTKTINETIVFKWFPTSTHPSSDRHNCNQAILEATEGLRKELEEKHVMQLAAISTAAISNTEATWKECHNCHKDYQSTAFFDVLEAVRREMNLRTRNKFLEHRYDAKNDGFNRAIEISEGQDIIINQLRAENEALKRELVNITESNRCANIRGDNLQKDLDEIRKVCGDRYPDARLLETVHRLREEHRQVCQACEHQGEIIANLKTENEREKLNYKMREEFRVEVKRLIGSADGDMGICIDILRRKMDELALLRTLNKDTARLDWAICDA